MKIKNLIALSDSQGSLGDYFRQRRFSFFENKIKSLNKPIKILDVGGTSQFWVNRGYGNKKDIQITLLNLSKTSNNTPNFHPVVGDATDLSEYRDNAFDIVFSNSVIEHLYNWGNQQKMASECQRVGVHYFIQTPNKFFFMEPHYLLPYFQFFPDKLKYFILTRTKLSRGHKWSADYARQYLDEIRLISHGEMKVLFRDGPIYHENFIGMSKSFSAHNFNPIKQKED